MADLPIVIPNTAVAPKDYTLSGGQELQLKSVRALIDGTAAATSFRPTLQLLDPSGHVMWEGAAFDTVAAGGSADVSWFPGVTAASSGIRYDIQNTGNWLYIDANGQGPNTPFGTGRAIFIDATGANGDILAAADNQLFLLAGESTPADATAIEMTASSLLLQTHNGSIDIQGESSDINVVSFVSGNITIGCPGQTSIFGSPLILETPLNMPALPIADPGVPGQIWNNGGVLHVSP